MFYCIMRAQSSGIHLYNDSSLSKSIAVYSVTKSFLRDHGFVIL